jgi:hypothetical protein
MRCVVYNHMHVCVAVYGLKYAIVYVCADALCAVDKPLQVHALMYAIVRKCN